MKKKILSISALVLPVVFAMKSFALDPQASTAENGSLDFKIMEVLTENAKARSIEEWQATGKTPEKLFEQFNTSPLSLTWNDLCVSLKKLSNQDLALFEEEIREHSEIPCLSQLHYKLSNHWAKVGNEFKAPGVLASFVTLMPQTSNSTSFNNSLERNIDVETSPSINDAGLAHGEVAITIDDGPHPTRTQRILEILGQAGVRATFFSMGKNAQAYPEASKATVRAGHSLGSHTWSHQNLPAIGSARAQEEITRGHHAVEQAAGSILPFFRFPYGASNNSLKEFVRGQGLTRFFWNMDSLDWKIRDPNALFRNVLTELNREKGGVILFHDIHEQTVLVLPRFLEELRSRGYKTVVFVHR